MPQLKEDEWPKDDQPTTSEAEQIESGDSPSRTTPQRNIRPSCLLTLCQPRTERAVHSQCSCRPH